MYECMFWDLYMRVPFDDFTIGVLCILNLAPSQLHPNRWVATQALWVLCLYTYVKATPGLFLHYFFCQLHKKAQWVSLIRILSHPFFRRFTFSYKKFKIDYFKVTIKSTSRNNSFFYSTGKPLFTFYWPQCPHWYNKYPKEYLTDQELWDLAFIKSLLCRLLARPVVSLIWSPNPIWDLNG